MGYNLYIGEMEVETDWAERSVWVRVPLVDGVPLGAPIDSAGTGTHHNVCSPSYTGWAGFAERVGLWEVFYAPRSRSGVGAPPVWWTPEGSDEERGGLLQQHPGAEALTQEHLAAFRDARARHVFSAGEGGTDWDRVRLDWLVWWTEWALAHCKYPTFCNG
jgi:hypothetical protein